MASILLSAVNPNLDFSPLIPRNRVGNPYRNHNPCARLESHFSSHVSTNRRVRPLSCIVSSKKSESNSDPSPEPKSQRKTRTQRQKPKVPRKDDEKIFPTTTPKKPQRGRKSEAAAVEDFVRDSLERTFASIREQNPGVFENKDNIFKERVDEVNDSDESTGDDDDDNDDDDVGESGKGRKKKMVVEEESQDWPLDADVGWGIRASDYFKQYPIENVVGEDGVEIDWEGELDDNWVKEINCLEWESFAFHPSPLIVLVFERYKR